MKKFILLIIAIVSFAMDIDIQSIEKNLKNNPEDIKNRLIVASYYVKNSNFAKAQQYINEVLKLDPKNKYALKLKTKIFSLYTYNEIMKNYTNINKAFEGLYKKQNIKKCCNYINQLKISLTTLK